MNILNKCLTLNEFQEYVLKFNFGSTLPSKLVIHHTWKPTKERWAGEKTILALKKYYEGKGWPVGPHIFVAEDGIWLFTPMNQDGIHATSLNPNSIGIEVVGDYDEEKWSGTTKINALGAIKSLMNRLNLTNKNIYFHRDVSSKSCPGKAITKEWLFKELSESNELEDMILAPVPDWATEAVAFVRENGLFEIRTAEDVRDAVKFYRFYKLIKNDNN